MHKYCDSSCNGIRRDSELHYLVLQYYNVDRILVYWSIVLAQVHSTNTTSTMGLALGVEFMVNICSLYTYMIYEKERPAP